MATVVGFATPGEAHDWRHGNRCDWVYNSQGNHGFQHQHQLGPRQIRRALRQQGFHWIRNIEYRRGIYRSVAMGRHGRPHQVFATSANGQVLCVSRIRRYGPSYRETVRRGHDRNFAWERDRHTDRNRDRNRW